MNDSPTCDALEIEVTDFGPIVEAMIDLRPLTVFVGPSNTGKSYLAILIYALHRHFAIHQGLPRGNIPRTSPMSILGPMQEFSDETVNALRNLAKTLPDKTEKITPPLSDAIIDAVRVEFETRARLLKAELARCFGVDSMATLIRREKASGGRAILRRNMSNLSGVFEHKLALKSREIKSDVVIPKDVSIDIKIPHKHFFSLWGGAGGIAKTAEDAEIMGLFSILFGKVRDFFFGPLCHPAYYLPADRTGVMHAHNVVVSALIERAAMTGIRPTAPQSPTLSGVLADFLEQLIEIDGSWRSKRGHRPELRTTIEEEILGGAVDVERLGATGYPRFIYRPNGWGKDSHLLLMNASSMVSELAPVVLYLRHIVERGDVLIVEEPESHLHPAMQVEFTRQIATLVQSGVRVIVTTHSEWLLEELANIVKRSEIPGKGRRGAPSEAPSLPPEDVGVWLFERRNRPKGSKVTEIKLEESGLYPSGFGKVAKALHNEWADISSRIGDSA